MIESDPVIPTTFSRDFAIRGEDENEGTQRSERPARSAGRAAGSDRRPAAGSMGDGIAADPMTFGTSPDTALALPAMRGEVSHVHDDEDPFASPIPFRKFASLLPSRQPRRAAIPPILHPSIRRRSPRRIRSEGPSPRKRGSKATPKPPTPDEESPTPLLKASLPTAEAGAERLGQAIWLVRRPHRTVPPPAPLVGSHLGTEIGFHTPG